MRLFLWICKEEGVHEIHAIESSLGACFDRHDSYLSCTMR